MRTLPGWFVSGVAHAGASMATPRLWRCPGHSIACPGNTSVLGVMTRPDLPCARDGEKLWCQCSEGHTGMLCRSCNNGWVHSSGAGPCTRCTWPREVSTAVLAGVAAAIVLLMCAMPWIVWRCVRPRPIEQRFFEAFADIETDGAHLAVDKFFGRGTAASGVTKAV